MYAFKELLQSWNHTLKSSLHIALLNRFISLVHPAYMKDYCLKKGYSQTKHLNRWLQLIHLSYVKAIFCHPVLTVCAQLTQRSIRKDKSHCPIGGFGNIPCLMIAQEKFLKLWKRYHIRIFFRVLKSTKVVGKHSFYIRRYLIWYYNFPQNAVGGVNTVATFYDIEYNLLTSRSVMTLIETEIEELRACAFFCQCLH